MMQFPAVGPAQGHLASVFAKNLAIAPYFRVAPEITANLIDVVEVGSENLTHIVEPSFRMGSRKHRQCGGARINQ